MGPVIAIDVMSGDREPRERIEGTLGALRADRELHTLLVGRPQDIEACLGAIPASLRQRVEIIPATQVIAMDEAPRAAVRRGRDSSMRIAVNLVREGRATACVSAGNTGALNAIAHFVLKTIAHVERAAIMSAIPSALGHTHMLDLGANTRATPQQLYQFAAMGAIVAQRLHGIETPRVGLLNIGEEDIKGHEVVQAAHALLGASTLRYVGFVEGDAIFSGAVDVVVTDGFTGNVALKTMEGLARLVTERTVMEFQASLAARIAGWVARPVLQRLAAGLDSRRYNGACMVGLRGIVVKSHGRADATAFARAVELAVHAARGGLTAHIAQAFEAQGG
ncbi:MAG TPA: phosphate acyltransferase PlsX [Steroidobacteraceae bacterium]|nr:phosphate acyltransferase PlsX [Steroidobacteraceae bacterium]